MKKLVLVFMVLVMLPACTASAQDTGYELGVSAYTERDYEKAVEHLKRHIERSPDARAYYILGYAIYALQREGRKEFGESAEYFRQAYLLDPDFDPDTIGFVAK
jgi:tetratricopeptide (TPR) repeat protein